MITAKKEGYQSDGVRGVRPGFGMDDPRGEQNFSLSPGQSGKAGVELTAEERTALQKQQAESTKKEQSVAELKQFFELGLQQVSLGQFAEAVESFKKAAEKDPEQPAVWANLGSAYGKLKQWDPAVEAYNKAIALKPNDPALYQNLAGVYSDAGDLDKSKEYFEKAAQIAATQDPKTAATQYYNIGVTNINAGRSQEAAEALNKALEFDPNHAEAHYQLGLTLLGLNKIEEAVSHLKKYAELAPAGPNAETAKALVDELGKAKK
jgi:Flp pilus assembly protein TadD